MTWRRATIDDVPWLEARMQADLGGAMFPLTNLRQHRLDGDHPRAMSFWIHGDAVFGISREGMIMPIGTSQNWHDMRDILAGHPCIGIIGRTDSARAVQTALEISALDISKADDEPAFALPLSDLIAPDCTGMELVPLDHATRDLTIAWRMAYHIETLGTSPDQVVPRATADIDSYIARSSHRVLLHDRVPVAMTGFNATIDNTVQVGGVYTPPGLRCRGYARRAVALHLAQARADGKIDALLFAASDNAAKAYVAIGFQPNGGFTMIFMRDGVTLG